MSTGLAWALAIAGGGATLGLISRDQLTARWRSHRVRAAARRQLYRDGWNPPG